MSVHMENPSTHSVAIVGMACKFPGDATSPSKLWDLCTGGQDAWSEIPKDRFDVRSLYDADSERIGRSHAIGGYFLKEDVARFDAGFFNFPADVASSMDPQLRMLLESVYEGTEDAGIPLEKLAGSNTSVFIGCYAKDYQDIQTRDPESMPTPFVTTNFMTMLANRVSHFYDLKGASMTIDTGCSGGLVALHQGCQAIRSGESDMSIIGASSLILSQDMFISLSSVGLLGPDGKCYAWDARAQGYGRGEGVAVLVLKSVDAAVRDGDRIHAMIRGSGLNQDGKTSTITSPSLEAQVKLINTCYSNAGLDLSEIGYVEAHMTGTKVGDYIEAKALATTFGENTTGGPILVGSIKTNIGHTEPVSGLAAVIKTALSLKHGQIAPNMNYEEKNPMIKLEEWNLKVPTELTPWPQEKPFRASINNFGYGGSNSHVILERAPNVQSGTNKVNGHTTCRDDAHSSSAHRVYLLSAKDANSCQQMAKNLAAFLHQSSQGGYSLSLSSLAYTLAERRSRLPWMIAVRASNLEELTVQLEHSSAKTPLHSTRRPRLGFVFNGQGAQWYAMGRELITAYPVFDAAIHEADQILKDYGATWSLYDELMRDEHSTRVGDINLSQPISVALQLCIVDLLKSWGIIPSIVTSHSSGEIAAAYAVNALTAREALGIVYFRGELALKYHKISPVIGGMLAAGVGPDQADQYIKNTTSGRVVVACINSQESVTLSGDEPAINEVASQLEKDGKFSRKLKVPLAYHSHHMLPMAQDYIEACRDIVPGYRGWDKDVVFASPVTGNIVSPDILTPEHWARNLTNPVRFSEAFESICQSDANVDMVVEVGAHSTLAGPIRQILNGRKIAYAACLKRNIDAVETMQSLVCELLARGYPVDLSAVNEPLSEATPAFIADLPTYPWNHSTRYWVEPRINKDTRYKKFPPHELLGLPISGSTEPIAPWRNFLRLSDLPWLIDHQVDSKVIFPAAGYISMAIEAARLLKDVGSNIQGFRLRDVDIVNALTIPESSSGIEVHTHLRPCSEKEMDHIGWYEFVISSIDNDTLIKNCSGFVSVEMDNSNRSSLFRDTESPREDSFFASSANKRDVDAESVYATMRQMGLHHGPAFKNLFGGVAAGGKAILGLSIPAVASETFDYIIHPTTLDTIIQATYGGLQKRLYQGSMVLPRSMDSMYVPYSLERQAGSKLKVYTELRESGKRGFTSNVVVSNAGSNSDASSISFLRIKDFHCQAIPMNFDDTTQDQQYPLCSKSHWEIDVSYQIPAAIKDIMKIFLNDTEADSEKKLLRASYYFIYDAVAQLKGDEKKSWAWHHKVFYNWMEQVVVLGTSGTLSPGCKAWSRASNGMKQMLNDELDAGDASGKLVVRVGRALTRIIRGEIMPLELMLEGAGTGGTTQPVLEAFSPHGDGSGSLLGHYTFTDVSAGFFEAAQKKLAGWTSMMDFIKLDIETDPATQSITGTYDIIVASMVLHATKSMHKTLSHVRQLLKPRGKLLLIEATQDRLDTQLIFGLLPGWWLSEESFRRNSPNMSLQTWDGLLKDSGFSGIDFEIGDCEENQFKSNSIILTTAVATPSYPLRISIVNIAPYSQKWVKQLAETIQQRTGISPSVENLGEVKSIQDKVCILTAEMDAPFLEKADAASFGMIQNLVVNSRGVLWLSCGSMIDPQVPQFAQTQGLLRTLRQEHSNNRYVQLDFEQSTIPWTEDKIDFVLHVFQQTFDYNKESGSIDWEYAVKDSNLYVPRVYADQKGGGNNTDQIPQPQLFYQPGRKFVLEPSSTGLLSDASFMDEVLYDDLPDGMVEIKTRAFGLNSRNIMSVLGKLPHDAVVAHDCAGIVTRLGQHTEQSDLKVGDRVCGIVSGHLASSSLAHWSSVSKLPEDLSWEEGAAIPIAYATAYHSLVRIAGLARGETVLIHAAAGGVGQAAIIIAQHIGADVFVTCSTEAKRDMLVENYGLSVERVYSSRDISFAPGIMTATGGRGVDVILNSLSGPLLKETWSCIAPFGRFVEIGKSDIEAARRLDITPFGRCATYVGFDIALLNEYDHLRTREALVEVGHTSQANYAAGNSFQDALARYRTRDGLLSVSLDLSAVTDVGYVADENTATGKNSAGARIEALGSVSLNIDAILRILEAVVLGPERIQPDDSQVIIGLRTWDQLPEDCPVRQDPRFGTLRLASPRGAVRADSTTVEEAANPTNMMARALDAPTEKTKLVAAAVATRLATIFGVPVEEVDLTASMTTHGVDSLVSVQLRNWLTIAAKAKVSIFEITQSKSLLDFAELVLARSQAV
ncbi:Lovastatin diketide synthase LovF [Daldinia childiae]|uniref:Lovastatin diketide synthase LovF n=1 Tax=Daldinia childiae TaxID=326645 RepID=UPI001444CAD1|nr:Lovastatin diketide synthase LovF [Daldinia childiae]KAF3055679.1 Lovastatin diketide synthase LovF [Daldinia childiae]